jgi:hypothetical protein
MARKDIADVIYYHTAEMQFVEFVCYFGGLLGLWLGISALDMFNLMGVYRIHAKLEYRKWLKERGIELGKYSKHAVNYDRYDRRFFERGKSSKNVVPNLKNNNNNNNNNNMPQYITSIYNSEKNYSNWVGNVYN